MEGSWSKPCSAPSACSLGLCAKSTASGPLLLCCELLSSRPVVAPSVVHRAPRCPLAEGRSNARWAGKARPSTQGDGDRCLVQLGAKQEDPDLSVPTPPAIQQRGWTAEATLAH